MTDLLTFVQDQCYSQTLDKLLEKPRKEIFEDLSNPTGELLKFRDDNVVCAEVADKIFFKALLYCDTDLLVAYIKFLKTPSDFRVFCYLSQVMLNSPVVNVGMFKNFITKIKAIETRPYLRQFTDAEHGCSVVKARGADPAKAKMLLAEGYKLSI